MSKKTISGRELRHGVPEESLSPGESVLIKKRGGKVFELRRVDVERKSFKAELQRIFEEIPITDEAPVTDLSAMIIEDRE